MQQGFFKFCRFQWLLIFQENPFVHHTSLHRQGGKYDTMVWKRGVGETEGGEDQGRRRQMLPVSLTGPLITARWAGRQCASSSEPSDQCKMQWEGLYGRTGAWGGGHLQMCPLHQQVHNRSILVANEPWTAVSPWGSMCSHMHLYTVGHWRFKN